MTSNPIEDIEELINELKRLQVEGQLHAAVAGPLLAKAEKALTDLKGTDVPEEEGDAA